MLILRPRRRTVGIQTQTVGDQRIDLSAGGRGIQDGWAAWIKGSEASPGTIDSERTLDRGQEVNPPLKTETRIKGAQIGIGSGYVD